MILYAHINGVDPFLVYSDKLLLGIGLFCFLLLFCFPAIFFLPTMLNILLITN